MWIVIPWYRKIPKNKLLLKIKSYVFHNNLKVLIWYLFYYFYLLVLLFYLGIIYKKKKIENFL